MNRQANEEIIETQRHGSTRRERGKNLRVLRASVFCVILRIIQRIDYDKP